MDAAKCKHELLTADVEELGIYICCRCKTAVVMIPKEPTKRYWDAIERIKQELRKASGDNKNGHRSATGAS